MPRSKAKRASGTASRGKAGATGAGGRLQTLALFVTIAAVGALLASLGYGIWQHFHPPAARSTAPVTATGPARPSAPTGRVRVEVLNATATRGLARTATDVLRDRGFDVVQTGNARGSSQDASVVLDRVGNRVMAEQVAAALGIARVETRRDTTLVLDVTVVLGKDWRAPATQP